MAQNPYQSPREWERGKAAISGRQLADRVITALVLVVLFAGAAWTAGIGVDPARRHLLGVTMSVYMAAVGQLVLAHVALRCPRERLWRLIPISLALLAFPAFFLLRLLHW
jgi:hypothetical protein